MWVATRRTCTASPKRCPRSSHHWRTAITPATRLATVTPLRDSSLPALIAGEDRRRRRRRWVWSALAIGVALAAVGVFFATRHRPVPLAARFRTAAVTRADLVREVRATGTVEAVSTVSVGAEISGRVASVEVDFNQHVTPGQVLARFDVTALEAQRAQSAAAALGAKAQVAQAQADLAQARRTRSRSDELFAQHAQPVSEHEADLTALAVAQARLTAAEASYAAQSALATVARTNLDHAVIRSPIDGVVITRNIDPGQTVASVMTTPVLFTVAADLRKMQVLAAIDEADISQLQVGQPSQFTVTAWLERSFSGRVTEVRNAARVVQDVVTYGALVEVDNLDLALKPGMTASVRVQTGFSAQALQVPNTALRFTPPGAATNPQPHVWVLRDGVLQQAPIHPGLSDGEQTAIAADDLPVGASVLVDLTAEGKLAYAAAAH